MITYRLIETHRRMIIVQETESLLAFMKKVNAFYYQNKEQDEEFGDRFWGGGFVIHLHGSDGDMEAYMVDFFVGVYWVGRAREDSRLIEESGYYPPGVAQGTLPTPSLADFYTDEDDEDDWAREVFDFILVEEFKDDPTRYKEG